MAHFINDFEPLIESDNDIFASFQHPFVADVSDNRPILQLLNEAKAEVVVEIEDLDESSVSHAAR